MKKALITIGTFQACLELTAEDLLYKIIDVPVGGDLIQITAINDKWVVSNGVNGHGNNILDAVKDLRVTVDLLAEKANPLKMEFNNPDFNANRCSVEGMTLQEENEAIEFLNQVIVAADKQALLGKVSLDKLHKLIWNYENACHYRSSHGG